MIEGKYKTYPEYKDSGVEWFAIIPSHWKLYAVRYLVNNNKYYQIGDGDHGAIKPEMYQSEGIPYIRVQNLTWVGEIIYDGMVYLSEKIHNENPKSKLFSGDILIAKTGATIGKLGLLDFTIKEANTTSSVGKISIDTAKYCTKYILYCFMSKSFSDQFWIDASQKSAQPGFNIEDLITYKIASPLLKEQQQIANFLDHETAKIDTLIEKQRQLIKLLKEKRQAVISHAVTRGLNPDAPMRDSGVAWLGKVPEHWNVSKLKYECKNIVDCPHSTPEYDINENYPAIRTADIFAGNLNIEDARKVSFEVYKERNERLVPQAGDIIYSREGERFGIGALVPIGSNICLGQRVMLFRAKSTPEYLMWTINSQSTYKQAQQYVIGSTSPHVNVATIKDFYLAWPPEKERIQISAYIDNVIGLIEKTITIANSKISLLQERRTALISAAVTGKIDVRDWKPAS